MSLSSGLNCHEDKPEIMGIKGMMGIMGILRV
jgi:hypothetical protein